MPARPSYIAAAARIYRSRALSLDAAAVGNERMKRGREHPDTFFVFDVIALQY